MPARVPGPKGREEDGRDHADHSEHGGQAHIADEDAEQQGVDHSLAAHLLGQLVRGVGGDVALQGLVVGQNIHHVPHLQRLGDPAGAGEVSRLVEFAHADAHQHGAHRAHAQAHPAGGGQKCLIIGAAKHGQQHHVQHYHHDHGDKIIERGAPHAHGGPLLGIVGHDGGDGLGGHVGDGVADDINHVEDREHRPAKALAGHEVEHTQQRDSLDGKAGHHQHPQLAKAGVHPVVHKGQKGIGDAVQNAGAGQDDTQRRRRDTIADAGAVAG